MKNNIMKVLVFGLFLTVIFQGVVNSYQITAKEQNQLVNISRESFDSIKVLALIGNGFGDSYFWVRDQLESWGCNYTTAGMYSSCSSCPNKPQRPVTSDILITDVDREVLSEFDAIFIPSGAHYLTVSFSTPFLEVISTAYEEGLVVSSICSGSVPIARANGIVSGVKVAYFFLSSDYMHEAGAIVLHSPVVVTDKRIITTASGMPYGDASPVYQMCVALAKEVLGYTALKDATMVRQEGVKTNYTLTVEVDDLTDIFYGNLSTEVRQINFELYSKDELVTDAYMIKISNTTFSYNFTELKGRSFQIDLEIYSYGYGKEVVRNATTYPVTNQVPGFSACLLLSSMLVASITLRMKQKRKK